MNILGEYGDVIEPYNMLNVKFLSQLINAYKKRRLAVDKIYQKEVYKCLELPKPVTDPYEQDKIIAIGLFEDYQAHLLGNKVFGCSVKYDILIRFGLLKFDDSVYSEAMMQAKNVLNERYRITTERQEAIRLGTILEDEQRTELSATVIAKEILLLAYYDQLQKNEANFADMLINAVFLLHGKDISKE